MAVLASSGTNLNKSRYLRMMAFCTIDMLITIPFTIGNLASQLRDFHGELQPYTSWADVHYGWSAVAQIPAAAFDTPSTESAFSRFDLVRWSAPIAAFIFFAIFGLTQDAVSEYRRILRGLKNAASLPKSKTRSIVRQP